MNLEVESPNGSEIDMHRNRHVLQYLDSDILFSLDPEIIGMTYQFCAEVYCSFHKSHLKSIELSKKAITWFMVGAKQQELLAKCLYFIGTMYWEYANTLNDKNGKKKEEMVLQSNIYIKQVLKMHYSLKLEEEIPMIIRFIISNYLYLEQYQELVDFVEPLLKPTPRGYIMKFDDMDNLVQVGLAFMLLGNQTKATEYLDRVLNCQYNISPIHLIKAHYILGDKTKAQEILSKTLESFNENQQTEILESYVIFTKEIEIYKNSQKEKVLKSNSLYIPIYCSIVIILGIYIYKFKK
ncbi:hypothetical protein DLAC_01338 [Tieghemostelium lacteum]|uniref:Tetratricopeptide repeat protein n=1 Tax=Tieghemostelium lacteum TaxID=361077 RepID=A0A152A8F6_TIELA|nr:hypothetical protein DLAC_01338 [Tieghemostelium lacteum]|eukprot:KYR02494.1 hypothetical protein DLAC_01338 [Tieghemostelium lacteum]